MSGVLKLLVIKRVTGTTKPCSRAMKSEKDAISRVISNYWQSFCKHIWPPGVCFEPLAHCLNSDVP